MSLWIPDELAAILSQTKELQRAYLVGGCVRDWLLGLPNKDYDVEVFGAEYDSLARALSGWGRPDLVGRSFGVLKLTTSSGHTYDFSLPRRDSKVAPGHKGFEVAIDPQIPLEAAAARRDFTLNSLMFDPRTGQVLDFFGGREDLRQRVLRHTSEAFDEDPLRVLRGMQLAGRFGLTAAAETLERCRRMKGSHPELAVERVREEWFKWAARAAAPSAGLRFLAATGWIEHYPELEAMAGTPQDPEWHPEGDVFVHTCHCCDALAALPEWQQADEESRIVYMLAVLTHDVAKPATTHRAVKEGRERIISPGHDEAGVPLAERFLERINAPNAIRVRVPLLVRHHMAHLGEISDRHVRRLARRLEPETIEGLCLVITADASGRPPQPRRVPEGVKVLRAKAAELKLESTAPRPILLGRHLVELGMKPGKDFKPILDAAFEAQLDGQFADLAGGRHWLWSQAQAMVPADVRAALAAKLDHPIE
jgi:tRNA nucleotidyltransferase (CCA-adding enzyme)